MRTLLIHPSGLMYAELERELADFRPEAVGFRPNYRANVPEVIDRAGVIVPAPSDPG